MARYHVGAENGAIYAGTKARNGWNYKSNVTMEVLIATAEYLHMMESAGIHVANINKFCFGTKEYRLKLEEIEK